MAGKTTAKAPPAPPAHLSERSQELWRALTVSRVTGIPRQALLQAALEALDRADQARAAVALEGLTATTKTTGALHVHPLVKVELDARRQFLSAWAALGLDDPGYL